MPKIFDKNCKIKVIEYGSTTAPTVTWDSIKDHVCQFVANNPFKKITKRQAR